MHGARSVFVPFVPLSGAVHAATHNPVIRHPPPVDTDLASQAVSGHGVPSQDPDPAAQTVLNPQEAQREARSTLVGGGVVAGLAAGAAIGVAVAGPVGVVVGATLGAVAGAAKP